MEMERLLEGSFFFFFGEQWLFFPKFRDSQSAGDTLNIVGYCLAAAIINTVGCCLAVNSSSL